MNIELTGGDLGVLNALVFSALTDARSVLVMDHIRFEKVGDAESRAAWERQAAQVERLEALFQKLESSYA